ncbi:hypothetical protein GLYMA_14G004432v4 [Glycine max]|nr:hypothetical protein GLYMA_14G004432v4 [Glycine max]KAH1092484.1 hypothetical protein GYH30_038616 [Glycine max]
MVLLFLCLSLYPCDCECLLLLLIRVRNAISVFKCFVNIIMIGFRYFDFKLKFRRKIRSCNCKFSLLYYECL